MKSLKTQCEVLLRNLDTVTPMAAKDMCEHILALEAIAAAAEKLVRCKGRYHSEHNYRALAALFGVTVPDLEPDLSGLKRYDLDQSNCDSCGQDCGADMSEEPDGDYVLFADVVSLLTSAPESGQ